MNIVRWILALPLAGLASILSAYIVAIGVSIGAYTKDGWVEFGVKECLSAAAFVGVLYFVVPKWKEKIAIWAGIIRVAVSIVCFAYLMYVDLNNWHLLSGILGAIMGVYTGIEFGENLQSS